MANTKELELNYPCTWEYKCIIEQHEDIQEIAKDTLCKRDHDITKSQDSKKGKYISYKLSLLVHSDDDRKTIFESLKQHTKIKFVL